MCAMPWKVRWELGRVGECGILRLSFLLFWRGPSSGKVIYLGTALVYSYELCLVSGIYSLGFDMSKIGSIQEGIYIYMSYDFLL